MKKTTLLTSFLVLTIFSFSMFQGSSNSSVSAFVPGPIDIESGPRSGEEVYSKTCVACHSTGAAGAPILGDVAAWSPRIAKGIDVLYTSVLSGFNGCPAKGLCMDCSEKEIKAVVDYMVMKVQ
jgi:cytochrome c5